jgi:hypothetical protein
MVKVAENYDHNIDPSFAFYQDVFQLTPRGDPLFYMF